jgi:polyisoprenoid-binding protein YceI
MKATFSIDPAHSRIEFAAKHMMVTTVRGQFTDYTGSVEVDLDDPTSAQGSFTINPASLTTGNDQRDAHLRSADFFDVERYPEITYASRAIERLDDRRYRVSGDLTIRGVTGPVELEVRVEEPFIDPWGMQRVGLEAEGSINRTQWGLNWNQTLEAGRLLVSEKVHISIEAALVRPAQTPAPAEPAEATA